LYDLHRFKLSFASFAELQNDEGTRTFLTIEIGAGHREVCFLFRSPIQRSKYIPFKLQKLCSDLAPLLQSLRQPSYYSAPRFHASIAWALLDPVRRPSEGKVAAAVSLPTCMTDADLKITTSAESQIPNQFAVIAGIPEEVIQKLNSAFGDRLSSPGIGCFDAESISLKIGKDIASWPFGSV